MSTLVKSAIRLRFGQRSPPPWVEAFLEAVEHLEPLDQKHEKGKRDRRLAQIVGDECRKIVGEIIVPVMNEEEEMLEEIAILDRAVEELRGVGSEKIEF
jgi:hypothetical protein